MEFRSQNQEQKGGKRGGNGKAKREGKEELTMQLVLPREAVKRAKATSVGEGFNGRRRTKFAGFYRNQLYIEQRREIKRVQIIPREE